MNGNDGLDENFPEALTRSIEIEPTATHPPPPGIHETDPSWKFVDTSLLATPEITADVFVQIAGVWARRRKMDPQLEEGEDWTWAKNPMAADDRGHRPPYLTAIE